MLESLAEKYIAEVCELYAISDKNAEKMRDGVEQIESALGCYYWEDVKHALQLFYTRHSDKSRPRLAQLLAVLESDRNVKKREPDVPDIPNQFKKPETNLWSIKDDFDRMIQIFVDAGIVPIEDGEYKNSRSIIDPATDQVVLNPMQWFRFKLIAAKEERPDLFVRYPCASFFEQLAIAFGNRLISFKVRDWKKLTSELRMRCGGVIPRENPLKTIQDARIGYRWHDVSSEYENAAVGA
jgi:hypothetical protein